ncbi:MAG: ribonucleoside-diphosphate reductase class Ib glutaredoxin subunit [Mycobacterium sp.]|nr:ribonucleoside-diphosphate reductase class Ib glutaredoxin subunit [Mycobacterium sp.]
MNTHLHPLRAKRPSLGTNSVANRYFAGQRPYCVVTKAGDSQINRQGIDYDVVDITADSEARDYVMALGYLHLPVVVAGSDHWAGFRPDRIAGLANQAA